MGSRPIFKSASRLQIKILEIRITYTIGCIICSRHDKTPKRGHEPKDIMPGVVPSFQSTNSRRRSIPIINRRLRSQSPSRPRRHRLWRSSIPWILNNGFQLHNRHCYVVKMAPDPETGAAFKNPDISSTIAPRIRIDRGGRRGGLNSMQISPVSGSFALFQAVIIGSLASITLQKRYCCSGAGKSSELTCPHCFNSQ